MNKRKSMKTIIIWLILLLFIPACELMAQVTDSQRNEYAKGNRNPVFLKEYIDALKLEGIEGKELEGIVEYYLLSLSQEERYTLSNWGYFIEDINSLESKVLIDVLRCWESLTVEQQRVVVNKVDEICRRVCFQSLFLEKRSENRQDIDCSEILAVLKECKISVYAVRICLMEMWEAWRMENMNKMVMDFEKLLTLPIVMQGENVTFDMMHDWVILGNMLNYMLENCTFEQCVKLLDVMNASVEQHDNDGFGDMLGKIRDDFEGKKIMMELGEE